MRIESIQVGQPKQIAPDWITAIYKTSVSDPVFLSKFNLAGDKQADLNVHGGLDKAVNVYPIEHYHYWNQRAGILFQKRLNLPTPFNGAFGENFTVSGMSEDTVCIGDIFKIGNSIVQVSQPRQPCWKLARKLDKAKLPHWMQQNGKTGWYFRVLQEGEIEAGLGIERIDRVCEKWTLTRANQLMHSPKKSLSEIEDIILCSALSESWQKTFRSYLKGF